MRTAPAPDQAPPEDEQVPPSSGQKHSIDINVKGGK